MLNFWQKKNFPLCRHWPVIYRIPKWSITTQRRKLKKQHAQLTPTSGTCGFPVQQYVIPHRVGDLWGRVVIHPSTPPGLTYLCSNVLSMHRCDRFSGTAYQCQQVKTRTEHKRNFFYGNSFVWIFNHLFATFWLEHSFNSSFWQSKLTAHDRLQVLGTCRNVSERVGTCRYVSTCSCRHVLSET